MASPVDIVSVIIVTRASQIKTHKHQSHTASQSGSNPAGNAAPDADLMEEFFRRGIEARDAKDRPAPPPANVKSGEVESVKSAPKTARQADDPATKVKIENGLTKTRGSVPESGSASSTNEQQQEQATAKPKSIDIDKAANPKPVEPGTQRSPIEIELPYRKEEPKDGKAEQVKEAERNAKVKFVDRDGREIPMAKEEETQSSEAEARKKADEEARINIETEAETQKREADARMKIFTAELAKINAEREAARRKKEVEAAIKQKEEELAAAKAKIEEASQAEKVKEEADKAGVKKEAAPPADADALEKMVNELEAQQKEAEKEAAKPKATSDAAEATGTEDGETEGQKRVRERAEELQRSLEKLKEKGNTLRLIELQERLKDIEARADGQRKASTEEDTMGNPQRKAAAQKGGGRGREDDRTGADWAHMKSTLVLTTQVKMTRMTWCERWRIGENVAGNKQRRRVTGSIKVNESSAKQALR